MASATPQRRSLLAQSSCMAKWGQHLARQVQTMMQRGALSRVELRSSRRQGKGVFATVPARRDTALCLYPGMFTPGLPPFLVGTDAVYLTHEYGPPSGVDFERNAYILNLRGAVGGYLDGLAVEGLVENPVACAQYVNHSIGHANVEVVAFDWRDIADDDESYRRPNSLRADGVPWYAVDGQISIIDPFISCWGAVFCASRDLVSDEELLLDYDLRPPWPAWSADWYEHAD